MQAYLTDEGRAVTTAVLADAIAAHERVFGVLTADEQQLLHDLLARVVEKGTGHTLFTEHIES
jgi:DNA-binding MarR family transcriptional regulator